MAMNFGNPAIQNQGKLSWDGVAARPVDIRQHIKFGFNFEAFADVTADAVFNIQAAPPSAADNCVPGTFVDVEEIIICDWPAVAAPKTQITIPNGTKAGQICAATLPCKPDAFIQIAAVSGDTAKVRVVTILSGPR